MFYAEITADEIQFAAFETEREAAEWIVDALGSDYTDRFWVDADGRLAQSSGCRDFGATVHNGAQAAIVAQSGLDPESAVQVLRTLCDVIEAAEG